LICSWREKPEFLEEETEIWEALEVFG